jgi:hypothetical protein
MYNFSLTMSPEWAARGQGGIPFVLTFREIIGLLILSQFTYQRDYLEDSN